MIHEKDSSLIMAQIEVGGPAMHGGGTPPRNDHQGFCRQNMLRSAVWI